MDEGVEIHKGYEPTKYISIPGFFGSGIDPGIPQKKIRAISKLKNRYYWIELEAV